MHRRNYRRRKRLPFSWKVGLFFAGAFAATTWAITPDAPGRAQIVENIEKRSKDQNYSGCAQARANNHEDIARWEPSYRPEMDSDGDGLACEPYTGH